MSTYSELTNVIEKMESDLEDLRDLSNRRYMNDYEKGFSDGAVETMEASLKFVKQIHTKLSWEETPNQVRGDMENEYGDLPPRRTEMGG